MTNKEGVAASTTAQQKDTLEEKDSPFYSSKTKEKLKEQVGELLLYLQSPLTKNERKRCWRMFELKLREYLAIKRRRR
jgi:hypothetical protein